MSKNGFTIELSNAQALVLFELLSRFSDNAELEIKDPSEERVLWNMCCQLEKALTEPFHNDYAELLSMARTKVLTEE